MAIAASDLAGLFPQPHQGVAARFARRLGGAVRTVVASGITLAGSLRRQTAPKSTHEPQAPGDLAPPIPPGTPRATRRPRADAPHSRSEPAGPLLPPGLLPLGLLPRLLGRKRRRGALRHLRFPTGDTPFTPKNCPGLSPEMCTFLNTPMEECDPDMLRQLFSAFEEHVIGLMPPEAAETIHAVIWGRLGGVLDEPGPNGPPAEALEPAPAMTMGVVPASTMDAPADAAPDALTHAASVTLMHAAPAAATDAALASPTDAAPTVPRDAMPAVPGYEEPEAPLVSAPALPAGLLALFATAWRNTPPASPDPLREAQAATLADRASIALIAAAETTPDTALPQKPALRRNQSFRSWRVFLFHRGRSLFHRCRQLFGCWYGFSRFGSRNEQHCLLSPPLLC